MGSFSIFTQLFRYLQDSGRELNMHIDISKNDFFKVPIEMLEVKALIVENNVDQSAEVEDEMIMIIIRDISVEQ